MPDGRVLRIDETRKVAYIVRKGRTYEAQLSDLEPAARVPSARVRFSLHRHNGIEKAESVKLRSGTRTSRRQRRFGDLTGAKRAGAKTRTALHDAYGVDVTTQPLRVAQAWVEAMSDYDLDSAAMLYVPSAKVFTSDGLVETHKHVRAELESWGWAGVDPLAVEIHGIDEYVHAELGELSTYFEIQLGQIEAQWVGTEPDINHEMVEESPLHVVARGIVPEPDRDHAIAKVEDAIRPTGEIARYGRVKLTMSSNDTHSDPALAEVTIDLDGDLVRAHASGRTILEATDRMAQRLHSQLERRQDRERHKPSGLTPAPGEWRHGNVRPRTAGPITPVGEREVVRHKSFAPGEMTVEEAAWDMGLLDYDFFLFVELTTGRDCLLERTDNGMLRLHGFNGESLADEFIVDDIEITRRVPAELSVAEAIDLRDRGDLPFVLFINRRTNRANVLYQRFDGHYGLITPPVVEAELQPTTE